MFTTSKLCSLNRSVIPKSKHAQGIPIDPCCGNR